MNWDLYGERANQYFRTWNTCIKLSWEVPRDTHTYFVDNMLAEGLRSLSTNIKSRYVKYFQSLLKSKSEQVRLLAALVGRDAMSTTGKNLIMLQRETGLNPWVVSARQVSNVLAAKVTPVPQQDSWRLQCLKKLLTQRYQLKMEAQDTKQISKLISSLCIN